MGDVDEYDLIKKAPLKLGDKDRSKKRKSKTKVGRDPIAGVSAKSKVIVTTATKAEESFRAKQDKIAQERILKKASKTHKQRVEEFNKHLDSLSEHYDIPKVSWTK